MSGTPESSKDVFEELFLQRSQMDAFNDRFFKMQLCIDGMSQSLKDVRQEHALEKKHLQEEMDDLKEKVQTNHATHSVEKVTEQQALTTAIYEKGLNDLSEHMRDVMNFQVSKLQEEVTAMQNAIRAMELEFEEAKMCAEAAVEPVMQHDSKSHDEVDTLKQGINLDSRADLQGPSVDEQACIVGAEAHVDTRNEQHEGNKHTFVGHSLKSLAQQFADHTEQHSYTLQESIWDAGLFFGLIGFPNNITLGIPMMMNLVMQVAFCIITWLAFSDPDLEKDNDMFMSIWRLNDAHDVANTNTIWPYSLASRICEGDASLSLAGPQQAAYDSITLWRPTNARYVGELMCVLSLTCFWSGLWRNFKDTMHFAGSSYSALGKRTSIITCDGGLHIESFGPTRSILAFTTFLLRFAVIINLAMIGTVWLSNTISIGELLLNSLALELVLNVDEMIYEAFAPSMVKILIETCAPLKILNGCHKGKIDVMSILGILLLGGCMPAVYFERIAHTSSLVRSAEEAVCGGKQNFVYGQDPLGIVYVHDEMDQLSNFGLGPFEEIQGSVRARACQEVAAGVPRHEWKYAVHEPSLERLKQRVAEPLIVAMSVGSRCEDILTDSSCEHTEVCSAYREALRYALKNTSIEWCSDLVEELHCFGYSRDALLAKTLCPVTCGCLSLTRGDFVRQSGGIPSCPEICQAQLEELTSPDQPISKVGACTDLVENDTMWQRWMGQARGQLDDPLRESLERYGCDGLHRLPEYSDWRKPLCEESHPFKALIGVCPRACGCFPDYSAPSQCPESCTRLNESYPLADLCLNDRFKEIALGQELYPFNVQSIEDMNKLCSHQVLKTVPRHNYQVAACAYGLSDLLDGYYTAGCSLFGRLGGQTLDPPLPECNFSCAVHCNSPWFGTLCSAVLPCTEIEQLTSVGCLRNCPDCVSSWLANRFCCVGCAAPTPALGGGDGVAPTPAAPTPAVDPCNGVMLLPAPTPANGDMMLPAPTPANGDMMLPAPTPANGDMMLPAPTPAPTPF